MSIHDLLDKMESAEDAFLETEFLAPVLPDHRVRVRIAGIVCTLRVLGQAEPGWAILKPLSMDRAQVVGQPSLRQIRDFLALLPEVRLLLVAQTRWGGLALAAHRGDQRFQMEGPVPVYLATGTEPFQSIIARFDGSLFWFQEVDRRRHPGIAAYLREALAAGTPPDDLRKSRLTAEEREAYRLVYEASEAVRRDPVEARLSSALAHAGAELASYIEREDAYTVIFTLDGRQHRSTVRKNDLTVLVAGICLVGQDRRFDLTSLVGVLREGQRRRRIVPVGHGEVLDEDAYWRIHPPDEAPGEEP